MSFSTLAALATMVAVTQAHVVILNAQGLEGSPASVAFGVDPSIARNCTLIGPCQLDTTLIRETEIDANIVNLCGRTQLIGNIDIAFHTENALAADAITQVEAGSELELTMHQVNADGAGPYACDIDEGSNSSIMEKQLEMISNVPGLNGISQEETQQFNITVKLPDDIKCTGGSTGNLCTVRCRNNAIAGPFGGCFPIQQVDVEPTINTPQNIQSFKDGPGVLKQIDGNLRDLEANLEAVKVEGSDEVQANREKARVFLNQSALKNSYPETVQPTPSIAAGRPTASEPVSVIPTDAPADETDEDDTEDDAGDDDTTDEDEDETPSRGPGGGFGRGRGGFGNGNGFGRGGNDDADDAPAPIFERRWRGRFQKN